MLRVVRGSAASGKRGFEADRPKRSPIAHLAILTSDDRSMAWSIAKRLVWLYDIGNVTALFHIGGLPAHVALTRHSGREIVFRSREASNFQHLSGCFDRLHLPGPVDVLIYDWTVPMLDPTTRQLVNATKMLKFDAYCAQAMLGHTELLAYMRRARWLGAKGESGLWLSIGNRPELSGLPRYSLYGQAIVALQSWSIATDKQGFRERMETGLRLVYLPVAVRPYLPQSVVHYRPYLSRARARQAALDLSDDITHAYQRRVCSNLQPRADHLLDPM